MGFLTTGIYSHFLAIFATNSQVHTVFNTRAKSIYHFDKIHQAGRHVSLVTGAAAVSKIAQKGNCTPRFPKFSGMMGGYSDYEENALYTLMRSNGKGPPS